MKSVVFREKKLLVALSCVLLLGCSARAPEKASQPAVATPGILRARLYNSGFALGDDNYNACFQASDGKIYYVIASASVDTGAQMFALNPATQTIEHAGDLTAAVGEKGLHAIPQGKGHSIFVESDGKLYFATHVGYYQPPTPSGLELMGIPPPGYKPYPGGHFVSYDLATHTFENLGKAPEGEGIISFAMDTQRRRLYGLTWPSGLFLRYDMRTHQLKNFGSVFLGGEKGVPGRTFRVICRSLVVDPEDGSVYYTTGDGDIVEYRYSTDSLAKVKDVSLKRDVFGCLNPSEPGIMAYNWRQAFWYPPEKVIYAVHGRSGYLFRFDPRTRKVVVITRLVSDETLASGMFDRNKYGYLGFELGPDGHTIYYLTGARTDAPSGADEIHFAIYDIPSKRRMDWGVLQLANGTRPYAAQSMAIGHNGMIYAIAKVTTAARAGHQGTFKIDLLSFPNPAGGK
jgi:hypothetical protein